MKKPSEMIKERYSKCGHVWYYNSQLEEVLNYLDETYEAEQKKGEGLTNGSKPHKCGEIAIHNGSRDGVSLCSICNMPVDIPKGEECNMCGSKLPCLNKACTGLQESSQNNPQWEERFDEKFSHSQHCKETDGYKCGCDLWKFKQFISQERTSAQQELLESLEKEIKKLEVVTFEMFHAATGEGAYKETVYQFRVLSLLSSYKNKK